MKKIILLLAMLATGFNSFAVDSLRVLMIGNSYSAVNNLPQVLRQMSAAGSHPIDIYSSVPGGSSLQTHLTNSATLNLIQQGNWDFVVLQEQSQIPAFPDGQVAEEFYPPAKSLDSLIHVFSPCAKTVFYMTWGYKYGDSGNCPFFPPICTYEGMDSLLRLRYTNIADSTSAIISPVGPLWHYLRDNAPGIELYQSDNSHPTTAGTFAAACSFYSIFFGENPQNNSYNFILLSSEATTIKAAAAAVVFDSLDYWQRFRPLPEAAYSYSLQDDTVAFTNQSTNADSWLWDFGDGQTDTISNPIHVFAPGTYVVCLTARHSCDTTQFCDTLTVMPTAIHRQSLAVKSINIYPNPVNGNCLHIQRPLAENGHFAIFDLLGRELQSGYLAKGQSKIQLSEMPSGVYLLQLSVECRIIASGKFQKW